MNDLRKVLTSSMRHEVEQYFREQSRSQYLGHDTLLCRILGEKLFFAIASDVGLSPHLIFDGYWEFWLTLHFANKIRAGDTVVDIGANLGYYSILAGDLVGPSGKVIAVEPNPLVFAYLSKSIAVNGYGSRVKAVNYALAADPDFSTLPFFVPSGEPKNGRFLISGETPEHLSHFGSVFDVSVGSLSEIAFDRIDLIKIDVEGAELQVLHRLRGLIEKYSPQVICEVNFARGYSYDDVKQALGVSRDLSFLDFDAKIKPLTKSMAESERCGEDWLICHE